MIPDLRTRPREYYDQHQFLYNWLWSPTALHYGLWADDTRTLAEAIERTNDVVSGMAEMSANDRVLDLGCGTGGSVCRFASQTGCHATGITISHPQARQAERLIRDRGLSNRVRVEVGDIDQLLPFPDKSFSIVTAIESFCHSHSKPALAREVRRVLVPGGRFILVDGFLKSRTLTRKEQRWYDICRRGWQVPSLLSIADVPEFLGRSGFERVAVRNETHSILRSSNRIRRLGFLTYLPAWIATNVRIISLLDNSRCMIAQRKMFDGAAMYGIVSARVPVR